MLRENNHFSPPLYFFPSLFQGGKGSNNACHAPFWVPTAEMTCMFVGDTQPLPSGCSRNALQKNA